MKLNSYKTPSKPKLSRELEILRLIADSHESGLLSAMQVLKILTFCTAVTESKTKSASEKTDEMLKLHRELVRMASKKS